MLNMVGSPQPDLRTFTAQEYLAAFEPGVLDLLPDADRNLREDLKSADRHALNIGLEMSPDGRYPIHIWERVYP